VVRWLLVLGLSLASNLALAQSAAPALRASALGSGAQAGEAGRFARVAAFVGVVSAGLLLGGSIAIAVVDDPGSERVTRGVQLGFTALAAPLVAFGAYSARRGTARLEGGSVRALGWAAYTVAIATGVAQWYDAFHDTQPSTGVTIALGALGALSVLPHAWDAYLCARYARIRTLQLGLSPLGLSLRF
jgi:hypothetical protein